MVGATVMFGGGLSNGFAGSLTCPSFLLLGFFGVYASLHSYFGVSPQPTMF
jgi:hypothetical protein